MQTTLRKNAWLSVKSSEDLNKLFGMFG